MNKKYFLYISIGILVISLLLIFVDYRISLGVILGHIFSLLNYQLIYLRYQNLQKLNFLIILSILFSIFVLVIPIALSFLLPNIFNWIGVIIGLLVLKIGIIVTNIGYKK